jgi:formate-dependent nitrite reductase cytochrome c552 subunit
LLQVSNKEGVTCVNCHPTQTQKKNSKDVKILFIAACMSSLGVQSCDWLLGRKGRGGEINGFSSSGS